MIAQRARRTALIIFPALTVAVSVACAPMDSATDVNASTIAVASPSDTTVPPKAAVAPSALQQLGRIRIARERPAGYDRKLFRHWIDADRDSCNTREEVLIAESQTPAQVDAFGCKVIAGDWFSVYDGVTHTDPSDLDVDHVVALKEAWDSGAHAWTSARRQSFANDLTSGASLIAVTAGVNRSKGDKDPTNWMPPRRDYWCTYLSDWVSIKSRWGLSMDQSEHGRIRNLLSTQCAGAPAETTDTVAPGPATESSVPTRRRTPDTTAVGDTANSDLSGGVATIKPGAFCAPEGARGVFNGRDYVCAKTKANGEPYAGNRARWRQG